MARKGDLSVARRQRASGFGACRHAIGVAARLLAIWGRQATAWQFTVYDVPGTPNSVATALTHDHLDNMVFIGYTAPWPSGGGTFNTAGRTVDLKWYPHQELSGSKFGPGTICVSNWPQK